MNKNMIDRMKAAGWDGSESMSVYNTLGGMCLENLLDMYEFKTVLDIGSGKGTVAGILREHGKEVTTMDIASQFKDVVDVYGDYIKESLPYFVDCIWCSHVLEHVDNPHEFLKKTYRDLKDNGLLAITVPPLHHQIVPGHISLWNTGLLLYHLARAGYDCRDAYMSVDGYNVSVIVRKRPTDGDVIDRLPFDWNADGRIGQ